jgi:hypothetical protein
LESVCPYVADWKWITKNNNSLFWCSSVTNFLFFYICHVPVLGVREVYDLLSEVMLKIQWWKTTSNPLQPWKNLLDLNVKFGITQFSKIQNRQKCKKSVLLPQQNWFTNSDHPTKTARSQPGPSVPSLVNRLILDSQICVSLPPSNGVETGWNNSNKLVKQKCNSSDETKTNRYFSITK